METTLTKIGEIVTILDSSGLGDALWCLRAVDGYDRELRLYAVWCARRVQHLMTDPQPIAAIDVAERYAHGQASEEKLSAAESAASEAWSAACAAAGAARSAARSIAGSVAGWAAWSTAWENERSAQAAELRRLCAEIAARDQAIA